MKKACLSLLWLLAGLLMVASPVLAQEDGWFLPGETSVTNPKARTASVSATVPDFFDPSTPILIAPSDGAILTTSTPTFSWYGVTDNVGVDHYQIWLDGASWFANLSTGSESTSQYTLTYNSGTNVYTLVPKSGIGDATHTWKISAYDAADNSSTSATWSFTTDTQAPSLVVTDIGAESTSISASDLSTVPTTAIELDQNEPLLKGTGEANASVVLVVLKGSETLYSYSFAVGSDGKWQKQLPSLERDVEITLNFTVTDAAGNISLLEGVKIIIRIPTLVLPPVAEVGPGTPTPTPGPIQVEIPLVPPAEVVSQLIEEAVGKGEGFLPGPVQKFVAAGTGPIVTALRQKPSWTNWLTLLTLILPAAIATLSLSRTFGFKLSVHGLGRIWQALGLLPRPKRVAIAINSQTGRPVNYTWLHISGVDARKESFDDYWLSDEDGYFRGVELPEGEFRASLASPHFTFPTTIPKPPDISPVSWYRGEAWQSQAGSLNGWIFPLDLKPTHVHRDGGREQLYRLATLSGQWWKTHLFLCAGLTLLWPSLWNLLAVGVYGIVLTARGYWQSRKVETEALLIDANGHPISFATVVIIGKLDKQFQITQSMEGKLKPNNQLQAGLTLRILKPDYYLSNQSDSLIVTEETLQKLPIPIVLHGRKKNTLPEIIN